MEDLPAAAVEEADRIPAVVVAEAVEAAVVPTAVAEAAAAIIEASSHSLGSLPRQCLGVWFLRV